MSAHTASKARRLFDQGRVQPIAGEPRAFTVRGDTGTYRVVVGVHMAWCDGGYSHCRRGACSHCEAGALALEAARVEKDIAEAVA